MTFSQLEYFCAVCRFQSIRRASEELFVSQPTISVAIRSLEKELGLSLFFHEKNRIQLTADGEQFYRKAQPLLNGREALYTEFSSLGQSVRPVRIGIPPVIGSVFFPLILDGFQTVSSVPVQLYEYGSVRACRLVETGELDAAFVNMDFYDIHRLRSSECFSDRTVFCVSRSHRLAGEKAVAVDMLRDETLILLNTDSVLNSTIQLRFHALGVNPRILLYSSQLRTILDFVREGKAGAFLYSVVPVSSAEFARIPIVPEITTKFGVVWKQGAASQKAEIFVDFIKNFSWDSAPKR